MSALAGTTQGMKRRASSSQLALGFDGPLPANVIPFRRPVRGGDAQALFETATEQETRGSGDATATYAQVVALDPTHADAHINLGRLLHRRGLLKEAEAHYVAALVVRADDPTATFNLAVVLDDQGRDDQAITQYQRALELEPSCVDAYFNLSRLYERKGEKAAAIRHLKDYRRLTMR